MHNIFFASMISSNWILTSASALAGTPALEDNTDCRAYFGLLSGVNVSRNIIETYIHENYTGLLECGKNILSLNNVAVMKVSRPVYISDNIRPVNISRSNHTKLVLSRAIITNSPSYTMWSLPLLKCNKVKNLYNYCVPLFKVTDLCDRVAVSSTIPWIYPVWEGSPALVKNKLVAIVTGMPSDQKIAYIRLYPYIDWIKTKIGKKNNTHLLIQ